MIHQLTTSASTALERFQVCNETVAHCLERGGEHAAGPRVAVMLDCADACAFMVASMARRSPLHPDVARLCAQACRRCAESCEQLADDEVMRRCAEICRDCAAECEAMVAA